MSDYEKIKEVYNTKVLLGDMTKELEMVLSQAKIEDQQLEVGLGDTLDSFWGLCESCNSPREGPSLKLLLDMFTKLAIILAGLRKISKGGGIELTNKAAVSRRRKLVKDLDEWAFTQHPLNWKDVERIKKVIEEARQEGWEEGKKEQSLFSAV